MRVDIRQRLYLAGKIVFTGKLPSSSYQDIPSISAEEVAEAKSFFPMEKFFIFGHARSGTTLLVRLIRLHPEVHCNYQAHFFTRPPLLQGLVADTEVRAWLARRSNRWNHGRDLSPVVLRAAADFIMERDARREGKSIVGDKSPSSLMNGKAVHLLHKVYPDARLIYIVRDGRDALISHRFQGFIDSPQHLSREDLSIRDTFLHDPKPYLQAKRSLFANKGLRRSVEGWVRNLADTDEGGISLFEDKYLSLRYEDLLENPRIQMNRLWSFLGVDLKVKGLQTALDEELKKNPDADWQQKKAGELIEHLEKGKQGSWRELFTLEDRQVFKEIGGRTLIEWGYEQDYDW